jgi:hypothetical protein
VIPRGLHASDERRLLELRNGAEDLTDEHCDRGVFQEVVGRGSRDERHYRGSIQLLLPLCLSSASQAEMAPVVEDCDIFYQAAICLTLEMAYNNARQLARPDRTCRRAQGLQRPGPHDWIA